MEENVVVDNENEVVKPEVEVNCKRNELGEFIVGITSVGAIGFSAYKLLSMKTKNKVSLLSKYAKLMDKMNDYIRKNNIEVVDNDTVTLDYSNKYFKIMQGYFKLKDKLLKFENEHKDIVEIYNKGNKNEEEDDFEDFEE